MRYDLKRLGNNKGIALILTFLVITVLLAFIGTFLSISVNFTIPFSMIFFCVGHLFKRY